MGISLFNILGLYEDEVEHAYDEVNDAFEALLISSKMDDIEDRLEDGRLKEYFNWDDATNSIIKALFDTATQIIEEEYGTNVEVNTYINGWDTHFDVKDIDFFTDLYDADVHPDLIKRLVKAGELNSILTNEQLIELSNSSALEDYVSIIEYNDDITLYENVTELGEDNDDNGCREEFDSDESFGQFLVQAYKDGNSGNDFYYEFSDGSVISGTIPAAIG